MATLGEHGAQLRQAVARDAHHLPDPLPVAWRVPEDAAPGSMAWKGIELRREPSSVSGGERVVWTGTPVDFTTPVFTLNAPAASVSPPVAYWIPAAWSDVIERLAWHGVRMERLEAARAVELELYRLGEPAFETPPFEGRVRVTAPATPERQRRTMPRGSVRVPTDQPLGLLAALLLEPASPDSFFQWGFFDAIFSRTEYAEAYVLEPLAARMLANDPALAAAFEERLAADPEFAADPARRLEWFYQRTPYADAEWRLYPVGRELAPEP
jgi:hypothetical protein